MSDNFYTADTHFNHDFVAGTRGFKDAEAHDEEIIEALNSRLTKRDTLWILGDLGMGSLTAILEKVKRIKGTKRLVLGNHDTGHPMHARSHSQQRRYLEVFESVSLHEQVKIDGQKVLLSHFSYRGDHYNKERYPQWRMKDRGMPLLHGHIHHARMFDGRQFNVGVDFGFEPITTTQVTQWLQDIKNGVMV